MSFSDLFAGFGINLLVALLIVRFIYYPAKQDRNYVFTFLAFNTVIYFVMSSLATTALGVGVGFGLFAIFSVVRYRTITMSPREMTYLFVLIALPVLNSLMMQGAAWASVLAVNTAVVMVLFVLEREWGFHFESAQLIRYERLELIKPEHHCLLLDDLRQRTGLPVNRVEIGRINFVNDSAELKIYFDEPKSQRRTATYEIGQPDD
jgi:hypothetical protein